MGGMAYDEGLATRLRELLDGEPGVNEKKMFGGLAMLIGGNMAVGVHKDSLIARVDPARHDEYLTEPGVRPFDITRRPMKGWLLVDPPGCAEDEDLQRWVERGVAYAHSLPSK